SRRGTHSCRDLSVLCLLPHPLFYSLLFLFNDTATPEIYTLSLHDALPISARQGAEPLAMRAAQDETEVDRSADRLGSDGAVYLRSEEHTSELQSRFDLVCRLLLEKKKNKKSNESTKKHSITASSLSIQISR